MTATSTPVPVEEAVEYRQVSVCLYMDERELNKIGSEGWWLVHVIDRELPVRYTFARYRKPT